MVHHGQLFERLLTYMFAAGCAFSVTPCFQTMGS